MREVDEDVKATGGIPTNSDPVPTLPTLQYLAHRTAKEKGFHEVLPFFGGNTQDTRHILSWLMLITTEVAEAAEAIRHNDKENFGEELADVCIRVFDTAEALGIDLNHEILRKMRINKDRPIKHGGKLA